MLRFQLWKKIKNTSNYEQSPPGCFFFEVLALILVTSLSEVGLRCIYTYTHMRTHAYMHAHTQVVASLLIDLQRSFLVSQAAPNPSTNSSNLPSPINQMPLCAAVFSSSMLRNNANASPQVIDEQSIGVHVKLGRQARYITLDVKCCVRKNVFLVCFEWKLMLMGSCGSFHSLTTQRLTTALGSLIKG